jgi:hypothetical protein
MTRNLILPLAFLTALALVVTACAATPPTPTAAPAGVETTTNPSASGTSPSALPTATALSSSGSAEPRTDAQGAVEFVVTPLNLVSPGATLDFDISMNTHSVDVSWDLAAQSVLSTDAGLAVKGLNWPAGGGHHYEGTLTFPAQTADGKALLEGAKTLTLTIRDTDVAERVFVWELGQ